MIEFSIGQVQSTPTTDWIFFSSKNAVKYFFELGYTINNRKLACIGKGTAKALRAFTDNIDFIGKNVDINLTSKQFIKIIKNKTCLFPISNISNKTIQNEFINPNQTFDVVVYNTKEKKNIDIPDADVLIFTSPSNVRSYYSKMTSSNSHKIIAIGPSTGRQLEQHGITNFYLPNTTGEIGLIDSIVSFD